MKLLPIFRIIALLEGISYVLLLLIATPLKYLNDMPRYVELLGMPHGILFILYVILAIVIGDQVKWPKRKLGIILVASILPFGTFYIDKKYLRANLA